MRFARLAWSLLAILLCVSGLARAQDILAPEGENVEVLDGAQWAPLVGVRGLAVTPDGMTIATVSGDGVLRLWDAVTGAELRRFAAVPAGQTAVAISADGKVVAAAGRDGSLQIWDVLHGRNLQGRDPDGTPIASLALSADGRYVAFGGPRRTPNIWKYLDDHDAIPIDSVEDSRGLAFGGQGQSAVLAITRADHSVVLVNPANRKITKTLNIPAGALGPVAFSLDGRALAAGADNGVVAVWDLASGKSRTIEGSSEPITSVRFATLGAGEGQLLLTTAQDGAVRVWNGSTLDLVRKLVANEPCCFGVASAMPRQIVAAAPRGIVHWDVASGQVLPTLSGEAPAVLGLATAGQGGDSIALISADGRARVVTGENGKITRVVTGVAGSAIALSPDEKTLAYADVDNVVHLFDVASGKDSGNTGPLEGTVNALAFSGDGAQLAGAVSGNGVQIWDPSTGRRLFALDNHKEDVAVSYSAGSHTLISARGASFTVWSADQGTQIRRVGVDSTVTTVALSGDGKRAAAGLDDGSIHVFDDTGAEIALLLGHGPGMLHIALSPDGQTLVSASADGTVGIWDVTTKAERSTLEGHVGGATALALSSDGSLAIAGTGDGALRLWAVQDGASKGMLRYAPDGWLSLLNSKVLRSETGRFLLHATDAGDLANRPPASDTASKLSADIGKVTPVGEGPHTGSIVLRIKNAAGAGRAFWVTAMLPRGKIGDITLIDPPVLPRLDGGESATLTIPISCLPSMGPGPQDVKLPLQIVDAAGKGPLLNVPVHITSARLRAQLITMQGMTNTPVARIDLTNEGDEESGPLTVVPTLVEKGKTQTLPVIQVPSLAPKAHASLGIAAKPGAQLNLTISGDVWPTYAWTATIPLKPSLPWNVILGVLVALLIVVAAFLGMRVSRHPIVMAVSRDPNELRKFALSSLPMVQGALMRARRLNGALAAAKIPEARWKRAVQASTSPEAAATAFAEAIGAIRTETPVNGQSAWPLQLPELQLRFPQQAVLLAVSGPQLDAAQAAVIGTALHREEDASTVAIALDLTESQTAGPILHAVPLMSCVVLDAAQLRDLLLHDEPLFALQSIIVAQRPLAELSPYQGSGGLDAEQLFFGRDRELRAMTDRVQRSFLVVAPRQMGKSTLLKAVHRRLSGRPDVEAHLITMSDDDLSGRVARQLNRPRVDTSEGFLELAAGTRRKPRVWLIDEADAFIHRDARNRYPISQAMRTLSEEGRAFFILSGFWHLYAAAYLSSNNPLRNFGEVVRLEPLDRSAARDLVTKPMEALGLSYENPELIEKLLDETACRAHLLVAICRGMVDRLGPADRVLTEANVHQGLYQNPTLTDEFKYWRREPLGRALVRIVMLYGPMTRTVLRETLTQQGLDVANELFQSTLDRLDLGYILVSGEDGKLYCPVPLLRRYIELEDSLESGLRRDIDDFLGIQTEGGPIMPSGTMPGIPPVSAA